MENIYLKTYELNDFRLDSYSTLQFSKESAMITTMSFEDLGFILDVLYIEKVKDNYNIEITNTIFRDELLYCILLTKKLNSVK